MEKQEKGRSWLEKAKCEYDNDGIGMVGEGVKLDAEHRYQTKVLTRNRDKEGSVSVSLS